MTRKPSGHDLLPARALNDELPEVLAEDHILRIGHFPGKQPVLDTLFVRFASALHEPRSPSCATPAPACAATRPTLRPRP